MDLSKKTKGKIGEEMAIKMLKSKNIEILVQNYRYKRFEIDIIAKTTHNTLLFIEVKLRKNKQFGNPEDFVSEKQKQQIIEAAENYILDNDWKFQNRFDIIAIDVSKNEIIHFEDAF